LKLQPHWESMASWQTDTDWDVTAAAYASIIIHNKESDLELPVPCEFLVQLPICSCKRGNCPLTKMPGIVPIRCDRAHGKFDVEKQGTNNLKGCNQGWEGMQHSISQRTVNPCTDLTGEEGDCPLALRASSTLFLPPPLSSPMAASRPCRRKWGFSAPVGRDMIWNL
jgi:hypothetical protein